MNQLSVGQEAPKFSAKNQKGEFISLEDLKGSKVILYFYPKDNTPGCTAQACNLTENISVLKKEGFIVLGVSPDGEKSHNKFIDKYNLQFDLLVDEDKKLCNAYGVWGRKKFMGREYDGVHRTTFIIDENGMIDQIINKVETKRHSQQILEL
tara:strand:- start:368 stop:823 length:456 start_codon:yes stop_codon:yes gene_type:complete